MLGSRIYGGKFLFGLSVSDLAVPLVAVLHGSGGGFVTVFHPCRDGPCHRCRGVWLPGVGRLVAAALSEAS